MGNKSNKLVERLKLYDLDTAPKLRDALGVSRQWARQILKGHITVKTAKRIEAVIDVPWFVIFEWKDGKGK